MDFTSELLELEAQGLRRVLRPVSLSGRVPASSRDLNFSTNDYLALSRDPRVSEASCDAVRRWGCGSGASRLMAGHLPPHAELEHRLAEWLGSERALVFGSGYLANLGLVSVLAQSDAVLFMDRLNHASLLDGARQVRARWYRYAHADPASLDALLARHGNEGSRRVVLTESLFSMDGDVAPLAELARVCCRHHAWLVVDEAHALGVFGPNGRGCWPDAATVLETVGPPLARVGTLSKSFGCYGGFVAGSSSLVEWLINRSRSFIYSTGLPPACAGAALKVLEILEQEPRLGLMLRDRANEFRGLLRERDIAVMPSDGPIVPVLLGENREALRVSGLLEERGIRCTAVRPPTVPAGTARLRFSVTLAHSSEALHQTAIALRDILR